MINITTKLLRLLRRLGMGEAVTASEMKYSWVKRLVEEGVLLDIPQGTRHRYKVSHKDAFWRSLSEIDHRLADLDAAQRLVEGDDMSRGEMVHAFGDSKASQRRTNPGFLVNSYEPIPCRMGGVEMVVAPVKGTYLFIVDFNEFEIPADVVLVGIENMENFYEIRRQRAFFERNLSRILRLSVVPRLLFVARYALTTDLRTWLQTVDNQYVHFGDLDLYGVRIFLTEYRRFLPGRSVLLIPDDYAERLQHGSRELYDKQYESCRDLHSDDGDIEQLIDAIHAARRGYEQEGYIG